MVFNVHAGHNPANMIACGAVGILNESTEARAVKNEVIRQLTLLGHTVYDCTCDNGTSQQNVLDQIIRKCNGHVADGMVDVSIHFNSGAKDAKGNGQTTGVEVYVFSKDKNNLSVCNLADAVCRSIASLGFKNRGVKVGNGLRVLKETKNKAMLIECCFVDDADDAKLYDAQSMATAIVYGLTGERLVEKPVNGTSNDATIYRVQVGAFRNKANAEKLQKDLKSKGYDAFITK